MTPATTFSGRKVALFGLGGSGLATAKALAAGGAEVLAWDDQESSREKARQASIKVADLSAADWSDAAALVLAPGVPLTHPAPHWTVEKAKSAGIEVIGDIELFCRERAKRAPRAPFIAITGTNGKSTTTALVAHILRTAGVDVAMGGNIGTPILALEPPTLSRFHVIECSSFQIDLAPSLDPTVGVLLNITPDHLDRHHTMENYAAVKARLVRGAQIALVSVDDDYSWEIGRANNEIVARRLQAANIPVSVKRQLDRGIFLSGTTIVSRIGEGTDVVLGDIAGISTLRGEHNAQNAAFALAAANVWQFPQEVLQRGLSTYPGLPHRLEEVGRLGPVLFINDSKATNADAAARALVCFDNIHWIAGGRAKEGGIESLQPLFGHVREAYLIGEAAEDFSRTLQGQVPFKHCGTLAAALDAAAADATASGREAVVLLSPACASYDQFANFEVRGDMFRELVSTLIARQANP
ncbi:MAG TPA: UDP-N-acetylmuramoyl-L-alanine--D-glutamate ligase [Beijerinckiaceae bacterium]|nr:UDP-N-acetylmuramoyl-L-alanine--D-glutamate ligase [Beijerinckiaceae bacterium]